MEISRRESGVSVACRFIDEPSLAFAGGREHVSPQLGINRFGPYSLDDSARHPIEIRMGLVGSGASTDSARRWFDSCADGVMAPDALESFPGCRDDRGFYSRLVFGDEWTRVITRTELDEIARVKPSKDRFSVALALISDKLRTLSESDRPPTCVIVALPQELYDLCRTVDFREKGKGEVHRDLRRAIKAEAMRYRIPTQLILQRTTEARPEDDNIDPKWKCAWNLFTGLYFKAGGIPWSPVGLAPGSCYVGISFFRPLGTEVHSVRSSVAQAFDHHGDGLVLRGQDFPWNESQQGRSPHLDARRAEDLLALVLRRYREEMRQAPSRVVVFKTSRFWPEEREGIASALRGINSYDLLSVAPTSEVRLLRAGKYPPLRGTHFSVGAHHFLYTTGYIPALNAYPHGHVPSPLQVSDHVGDTPISTLLEQTLTLTKLNWNSASFAGLWPITLRFARLVGDVMREVPDGRQPEPGFRFYI